MNPIYIVDDSADQRLLLGYFIKRINPAYQISFFEGAQHLFNSLEDSIKTGTLLPQIIILDLQMPGITGFNALQTIKQGQNQKFADIPVAILSSYVDQDLIGQCLSEGATAFLHKPVDFQMLRNLLTEVDLLEN